MAKKVQAYVKLQVAAGMANQVHRLVQHWVNKVLTSWNSVKRSTQKQTAWKRFTNSCCYYCLRRPFFHFRYQNSTCSSSAEKAAGVKSGSGKPNKDKVGKSDLCSDSRNR